MGLTHSIKLTNFINDELLRIDTKFHILNSKIGWNIFEVKNKELISLKNILKPYYENFDYQDDEEYKGIPTGREYLNEFGDIISFQIVTKEEYPNRLKYKIDDKCILISSLKGARTPALTFDFDLSEYVFSNGFYIFKIVESWNKKFVLYLLRTDILKNVLDNHIYRGIGISSYQESDFLKIQIPNISLSIQNEIVKKLEPIEQEIQNLKLQKKVHLEVINEVFAAEFDFDLDYIAKERDKKLYQASFIELANDELKFDISLKYKAIFEKSLLKSSNQWIKLDKIVEVKGGKRLPKGENILEEDTGYKYIRVDDLSWSGFFDYDNVKYITYENHLAIKNYISNTDDILLTIVGATVGKCGLVTDEIDGHNITENFARLIIKDKTKYFPQYVTYCLQSKICQLQVDEFTGKGSQGKLALFRVKKIRIPDIEFNKQKQIVEKIKSQINVQKLIDEQIEQKQKEISDSIYQCVKGS